jgi:hypothetical protein
VGHRQLPAAHGQLWEEAQMGKIADASIRDDALDHFFPLPNLLAEIGLRLGGYSLSALRASFVVAGAAAVPIFLVAALALGVGRLAALAATALFACSAYLSVAGRVALESHSPILTLCAALAACFHALRSQTAFSFALAGACSGLLMTEYTSYRLYPPLLAAMLAVSTWRAGGRAAARRFALHLGCAIAVMLPVLLVPNENPLRMLAEGVLRHRGDMAAAAGGGDWLVWASALGERIGRSASFAFLQGSANDLLPASAGVVDFYTGIAGLAALGYCATRARRDPAAAFLVVAAVATVVLAGALTQNPSRYRITPLPPLLFLSIALALDAALRRWPSFLPLRAGAVLLGALVAASCAFNLHLLAAALGDPWVAAEFGDRRVALALEIGRLQERFDRTVLIGTGETYLGEPNDFAFLYDVDRVHVLAGDLPDRPGILLVDEEHGEEARRLAAASGCFTAEYVYGPRQRVAFVVCEIGFTDEHR